MKNIIDNYLNGNLKDAKLGAKTKTFADLSNALVLDYGYSFQNAMAVAGYLKNCIDFDKLNEILNHNKTH